MMFTKKRFGEERGTCYSFHPRKIELAHLSSVPLEPGAKADRIRGFGERKRCGKFPLGICVQEWNKFGGGKFGCEQQAG